MQNIVIENTIFYDHKIHAYLLIEMLAPFEILTTYVSRDKSIATSYVAILIEPKNNIGQCSKCAQGIQIAVNSNNTVSKVEKCITQFTTNYNIIYSSGMLDITKRTSVVDAFKSVTGTHFYTADGFTKAIKRILKATGLLTVHRLAQLINGSESDTSRQGVPSFHTSLIGNIYNIDSLRNERDIDTFIVGNLPKEFRVEEELLSCFWKDMRNVLKVSGRAAGCDINDKSLSDETVSKQILSKCSEIEKLVLEDSIWIGVYRNYINECRRGIRGDIYLPYSIEYLLSLQVTSVNTERTFSKLKSIYGDQRHRLNDKTVEDEAIVTNVI
ncbi:similar to Vanderwaltozyma polyspora Kpol_1030p35 hypothetical protein [Vanderwaltozyma polyspora DSM 70294]. Pseudogene (degenerate) [Maudiozyma saulgeensis]|uniref:HAT C-terminal dimerisation domain-containing protein n=1 Tax=Maudiozyma saulgeensis TaxID=1789683 RepID=A0A1X7QZL2_9SACH|nr:similar to Vanderwaltozyma polyspora Kpol_1030p35 hypothetical protein [Vanderwaltozyma polyspora DSM 70294]. Pseudogene (degenerate) [Kazachstania saulgeensis]